MSSSAPTYIDTPDELTKRVRRWSRYRRELAGFLIDVLCVLVSERATGCLKINFSQGSVACAEFEHSAAPPDEFP